MCLAEFSHAISSRKKVFGHNTTTAKRRARQRRAMEEGGDDHADGMRRWEKEPHRRSPFVEQLAEEHGSYWIRNMSRAFEDMDSLFGIDPSQHSSGEYLGGNHGQRAKTMHARRQALEKRRLQAVEGTAAEPEYITHPDDLEDIFQANMFTYLTIQRGERWNVYADNLVNLETISVSGNLSKEYDATFDRGYQLMMQVNVPRQFWIPNAKAAPNYLLWMQISRERPQPNPYLGTEIGLSRTPVSSRCCQTTVPYVSCPSCPVRPCPVARRIFGQSECHTCRMSDFRSHVHLRSVTVGPARTHSVFNKEIQDSGPN